MANFPKFLCTDANRVPGDKQAETEPEGYLFAGADGVQVIFRQSGSPGESPEQVHDFREYTFVVEGTFDGLVSGKEIHLEAGDEIVIPPGVQHSGHYSADYRSIDVFEGPRVT